MPRLNRLSYHLVIFVFISIGLVACGGGSGTSPDEQEDRVPAAPLALVATAGDGEVALGWSASDGATSYKLYYSDTAGVTTSALSYSTDSTSTTVTGLSNETTYYFVVSASNSAGESGLSAEVSATPSVSPPSMANLVGSSGLSRSSISLEWLAATDAETVADNLVYTAHLSESSDFQPSAATAKNSTTGGTSLTVDGLLVDTTYYVMIVTTDEAGNDSWSNILAATTLSLDPVRTAATVYVQDANHAPTVNGNQIIYQDATETPAVGEILISGEGDGYLRKATSVSKAGDTVTVETEPAYLNEVFSELEIATTIKMAPINGSATVRSQSRATQRSAAGVPGISQDAEVNTVNWPESGLRFEQVDSGTRLRRSGDLSSFYQSGEPQSKSVVIAPLKTLYGENFKTVYPGAVAMEPGEATAIDIKVEIIGDQTFLIADDAALRVCRIELLFYDDQNGVRHNSSSFFNILAMIRETDPETGRVALRLNASDTQVSTEGKPHHFKFEIQPGRVDDNCQTLYAGHEIDIPVYVTKGEALPREEEKSVTFSGGFTVESDLTLDFNPSLEVAAKLQNFELTEAKVIAHVEPKFRQELTITATGAATLEASQTFIKPRKFYRLFSAGPVPILIIGAYSMDATLTGEASGKLTLSESIEFTLPNTHFGFEYDPNTGNWNSVKNFDTSYTFRVGGEGDAGVELTLTLNPQLVLSFYDVLSGSMILNPYVYANAGIHGQMIYVLSDGQDSLDIDYWFTNMEAGGGIDLKLWAGFKIWNRTLASWPSGVGIEDVDDYKLFSPIEKTPIAKIPELSVESDLAAKHPEKSRAFRFDGSFTDVPNPFGGGALLPFSRWMTPHVITLADGAQLSPVDPTGRDVSKGEEGAIWLEYEEVGEYEVRLHGHSSLGWFIRQAAPITLTLTDDDDDGMVDQWETQHGVDNPSEDPEWDTLTNLEEFEGNTDPNTFIDDDEDGMPDLWETKHGVTDANGNPDDDDFTNLQEWQNRTDPNVKNEVTSASARILFASTRDGGNDIFVMDEDGSNAQNLTNAGTTKNYHPTASPDGTRIAFTSERDGHRQIYVMNSNGTNQINISNNDSHDGKPSWSPDGKKIAFHGHRGTWNVMTMNVDGSGQTVVGDNNSNSPAWSPDGSQIIYTTSINGAVDIYVMNSDGSNKTQVTSTPDDTENHLAWSPDGSKIAFSRHSPGGLDDVFVMDPDGTNVQNLTNSPLIDETKVAWSPDGTKIVFDGGLNSGDGVGELYIMNSDGSELVKLTNENGVTEYDPTWIKQAGFLNDTGIFFGGDSVANNTDDCIGGAIEAQDCSNGRDALAMDGNLVKSGEGDYGFDFIKIDANGNSLPTDAAEWSCVKDNVTQLIWEVKTADGGLHDGDYRINRITWYNSDPNTNGGNAGTPASGECTQIDCDTEKFVAAVNAENFCGRSNWRVPTRPELLSIVDYGKSHPSIDTDFFPNTESGAEFWTATQKPTSSTIWGVYFRDGSILDYSSGSTFLTVRLVSDAN